MASKTCTLSADFDITEYPYLMEKSDNVSLTINQAVLLDDVDDYVSVDGLITQCANYTTGTIATWAKVDIDTGAIEFLFAISRDADNTDSSFNLFYDLATNNRLRVSLVTDGTTQWEWTSVNNYLLTFIDTWTHIAITHNATTAAVYVNGTDVTATQGSFTTSTDKTKWLKSVITDATSKSDSANIGTKERNGSDLFPWDGWVDKFQVYNTNLSAAQVSTLAAEDRIGGASAPTNCVCNIMFRGDADDDSGTGNNGTLINHAQVINDNAATGIYPTTSPVAYPIEAGNEYVIDAGAGNYVSVTSITDNETVPAGTSIKYKYAFSDNATRAGASWSGTWEAVATASTNSPAASVAAKKRYMHFKFQINSDGTADAALSDVTVNYNAVLVSTGVVPFMYYQRRRRA